MEDFEGADWVLISDESPIDEGLRDELMQRFQVRHGSALSGALDSDDDIVDDDENAEPEADEVEELAGRPSRGRERSATREQAERADDERDDRETAPAVVVVVSVVRLGCCRRRRRRGRALVSRRDQRHDRRGAIGAFRPDPAHDLAAGVGLQRLERELRARGLVGEPERQAEVLELARLDAFAVRGREADRRKLFGERVAVVRRDRRRELALGLPYASSRRPARRRRRRTPAASGRRPSSWSSRPPRWARGRPAARSRRQAPRWAVASRAPQRPRARRAWRRGLRLRWCVRVMVRLLLEG